MVSAMDWLVNVVFELINYSAFYKFNLLLTIILGKRLFSSNLLRRCNYFSQISFVFCLILLYFVTSLIQFLKNTFLHLKPLHIILLFAYLGTPHQQQNRPRLLKQPN